MRLYGRQEFLNQANDKVTLNKKLITKEARYILEEKLSLDIEFYEYLLQRLFNQANKSGILPPWKKGFIFIASTHSQILRSIIFSNVKPC